MNEHNSLFYYLWVNFQSFKLFRKFLCEHFSAVICYTNSVCCVCVFFVRIHYAFAAAAAVVLFVRCDTAVAAIEYTINRQSYWKNSFIHFSHRHSNFHKCFGMLEERNAQNMFLINGSPFLYNVLWILYSVHNNMYVLYIRVYVYWESERFFIANGAESCTVLYCMWWWWWCMQCRVYGMWIIYFQGHFANIFPSIILF